jgi:hypothetical protein
VRRSRFDTLLHKLQEESFDYFLYEYDSSTGLVPDGTQRNSPASIAATGLALTAYPIGVERGFMKRADALRRALRALKFFCDARQSPAVDATGYKGFFYHFLDRKTGRRTWDCELSTIDTGILIAGMLTAAQYFNSDHVAEREVRERVETLTRAVNWHWATNGAASLTHGWRPERKRFIPHRWTGYNEGLLLYILALGSPMYSLPAKSYSAWTSSYQWRKIYNSEYLFAGPLFIHQLTHCWIDFRGIQDDYMRAKSIDYFENSCRATYVQSEYGARNPLGFTLYSRTCWGFTACEGPGWTTRTIDGRRRVFFGYRARGVPYGPDDGTIAPWSAVTSLPFAPEIVVPTIEYFTHLNLWKGRRYGFEATFNPTFPCNSRRQFHGWVSRGNLALNQGPLVIMIENFRSGLIWRLLRQCPWTVRGLRHAGFAGSWLGKRIQ